VPYNHYFQAITNRTGDSLVGYFVRVINTVSGNTVPLYADLNGTPIVTVSGAADMAKTDENGNVSFYNDAGTYHLDIYQPDATTFILRVPNVAMQSGQGPQGDPGPTGEVGASDSAFPALAALKAIDPVLYPSPRLAAASGEDGGTPNGLFTYQTAGAPYTADNVNIIKLDTVPLTTGALVRQRADSISFRQAGTVAAVRDAQEKARETVSVTDFYVAGDVDDSASFVRAMATGAKVYVPGGKGHGPGGRYYVNNVMLVSGAYIFGDGREKTIIKQTSVKLRSCFNANSGSATATIDNFVMEDVRLEGWVVEDAFFEQSHLLCLSGTRGAIVQRCTFYAFQGDGIYVGSGDQGTNERHNYDTTIRDNIFDGGNSDNRQGISVLDGTGGVISSNLFIRCTRPDMPGSIDFEPNTNAFHVIRDWVVDNNDFDTCGGNFGVISVYIPPVVPTLRGLIIRGNRFRNTTGDTAEICIETRRIAAVSDPSMQIVIDGNVGRNGNRPVRLLSCKGAQITGTNDFQDYTGPAILGFNGASDVIVDVEYRAKMLRVAPTGVSAIQVGKCDGLVIGATIAESAADSASGFPIQHISVAQERVSLEGNRITKRPNQVIAINKAGTTWTAAGNRFRNNELNGLSSQFESVSTDPNTIALSNGWTGDAFIDRLNVSAVLNLFISGGTLTAGTVVGVVPVGYRPRIASRAVFRSGTGMVQLRVDPNGNVLIEGNAAPSAAIAGSITYALGV